MTDDGLWDVFQLEAITHDLLPFVTLGSVLNVATFYEVLLSVEGYRDNLGMQFALSKAANSLDYND